MAKEKTVYVCSNCGQESPKWVGKCPSCGAWNTYVEEIVRKETVNKRPVSGMETAKAKPVTLDEIAADDEPRIDLHDAELNRVLGGGLVQGSLVLIGGEPGIGKSTLVLQTILRIPEKRILYISGEESARQLKLRADRLSGTSADCLIVCETSLEQIYVHIKNTRPDLVIIDSIQTISTETLESSPGSIAQVRECSASILRFAKETRSSSSAISTRKEALPGLRYWSTLWTPCSNLKATNIICTASCAASKTVSAALPSWASMR